MRTRTRRTPDARASFLTALEDGATVRDACKAARIARSTAYDQRARDTEFAAAWDRAIEIGADALEDEAVRRGRDGFDEPIFWQGAQVGTVRRYSDALLMFLLKGRRPDRFRERAAVDLNAKAGTAAVFYVVGAEPEELTAEQWAGRYRPTGPAH